VYKRQSEDSAASYVKKKTTWTQIKAFLKTYLDTLYTKYPDTGEQAFLDADHTKLDGIETGATKYPDTGEQAFLDADHTKLDGIAANATKYPDTGEQAFLDADHTKLDGIEAAADVTDAVNVASVIHAVASKATPVDADEIAVIDTEAANVLKKSTWTNIKAFLKTYFDTLYDAIGAAAAVISDTAYNESSWNGVTTIAPSKNAVRDQRELDAISMLRKNVIINGNFDIWQRGTSFSNPATTNYLADRWSTTFDGTGGTTTVSRQTFTLGQSDIPNEPSYFLRYNQSVTKSGGNWHTLIQKIEDVRTLAGKTVSVRFYMRANTNGETLPAIKLRQHFGTGGSPSNVVEYTLGTSVSLTADTWTELEYTTTLDSLNGKTLGTNNDHALQLLIYLPLNEIFNIDIAQVQIEEGSVATRFEQRSIGEELTLCQRYYEKSYDLNTGAGGATGYGPLSWHAKNAVEQYVPFQFKISKRERGTIKLYSTDTGVVDKVRDATGSADLTVADVSGIGFNGVRSITLSAGPTVWNNLRCHWTIDAEL